MPKMESVPYITPQYRHIRYGNRRHVTCDSGSVSSDSPNKEKKARKELFMTYRYCVLLNIP